MPSDPKANPDVLRVDGPTRDAIIKKLAELDLDLAADVVRAEFPVSAERLTGLGICSKCDDHNKPCVCRQECDCHGHGRPVSAEPSPNPLRAERDHWKAVADANVAIQLALSDKLNERDRAIRDALESLDRLGGHRCREQGVFLAHIDSIQDTLCEALATDQSQSDRTSDEATPAEPVYEWRVCFAYDEAPRASRPFLDPTAATRELQHCAAIRWNVGRECWLERRTAPGPWGRVDDGGRRDG